MLVDEVKFTVEGGRGGDGKNAFFPNRGGPSGGDGGDGGRVLVRVNPQLSNLNKYSGVSQVKAGNGGHGESNRKAGARGEDVILELPIGTTIIDLYTKENLELLDENDEIQLAKGGKGGFGNSILKTATSRGSAKAKPGRRGQVREIKLVLRLIADYGLIGIPNAGKSTLLNELTAAQAKVANYPFTTLEPNLGVLGKKVIADIPGLIEGASSGKGLGIRFLKHIEKVKLLIHCISAESTDVLTDFKTVMEELAKYNPVLAQKDLVVLLTKTDLISEKEVVQKVKELKKVTKQVYPISILDPKSLENLRDLLMEKSKKDLT